MFAQDKDRRTLLGDLAESNRLLNLAEQIANVGHWRLHVATGARKWSDETYRIFGLEPGVPIPDLGADWNGYSTKDWARLRATLKAAAADKTDFTIEAQALRASGDVRDVVIRGICEMVADHGEFLFGVIIDITEQKQAEARYRLLAENTSDMIVHADRHGVRLYVSPSVKELLGYDPDELVGSSAGTLVHPDDAVEHVERLRRLTAGELEGATTRKRFRRKDGSHVWVEIRSRLLRDDDGAPDGFIASIRDCSQSKAAEEKAERMARHDPLTGLGNRTLLRERLNEAATALRNGGPSFALLWMDLDRFKAINDSFGHLVGDRALAVIANRLKAVAGRSDTIARLGGDEFVILQHAAAPSDAESLADRIIATVSQTIDLGDQQLSVGVSIGLALLTAEAGQVDALLKNADLALYRAKRSGRNTYCWYESATDGANPTQLQREIEMRDAIRDGGFVLQYQPIVDVCDGEIHGSEALVRWRHPVRGMIPPNDFIPLAEQTGLIVPLGDWVLRTACLAAAKLPGLSQIAVNVSGCQFTTHSLEARVLLALTDSGLDPARLELEITESVLIKDEDAVMKSLVRLRDIGVRIALDDFGTGYSSLSYLRRFQFDRIKIDRSFVKEINTSSAAAIIRAVAGLAADLGIKVTAEGIETLEQLRLVREYGCTHAQGFLFSRPTEAAHLHTLMLRQETERQTAVSPWAGVLPINEVLRTKLRAGRDA